MTFRSFRPASAKLGYFTITWTGPALPGNHRVFLHIDIRGNWIDITPGYQPFQLQRLLEIFNRSDLWGLTVKAWLESGVAPGGADNVKSNELDFAVPVRPLWASTLNTVYLASDPQPLTYAGNRKGSWFTTSKIDGRHYFFLNGREDQNDEVGVGIHLVADPALRGLDCTTFPLALFEIPSHEKVGRAIETTHNYAGEYIAGRLGATADGIEGVSSATMRLQLFGLNSDNQFVQAPREGCYLLWVADPPKGHILIYRGDMNRSTYGIHEFNAPGGNWGQVGYIESPITGRSFGGGNFWARKIPFRYWHKVINTSKSKVQVPPISGTQQQQGGQVSIGQPAGGAVGALPSTGGSPPANGRSETYTVVSGDSLSLIAGRKWGDVLLWPILYDANRQVVGSDPNLIKPGQKLKIPDISGYSSQQLSDARSRGRNC